VGTGKKKLQVMEFAFPIRYRNRQTVSFSELFKKVLGFILGVYQ